MKQRFWWCCAGWALLMSLMGGAQARPPVGMPGPLVPVTVPDPTRSLVDAPVIARMKLPRGWKVDVDLFWHEDSACPPDMAQLHLMAVAPGGLPALEVSSTAGWLVAEKYPQASGSDVAAAQDDLLTAGCLVAPYAGLEEFLRALAHALRPQAELLAYRELPQQLQRIRSQLAAAGEEVVGDRELEAGELLMRYVHQGKQVREAWQASTRRIATGGLGSIALQGNVFALRMEEGAFDPAMLEQIVADVVPDEQWRAALRQRTAELAQAYNDRVMARLEQATKQAEQERAGRGAPSSRRPYYLNPREPEPGGSAEPLPVLRHPPQVFAAAVSQIEPDGLLPVQLRGVLLAADDKVRQTMQQECAGRAAATAMMAYVGANEDSRRQLSECWRRWGTWRGKSN